MDHVLQGGPGTVGKRRDQAGDTEESAGPRLGVERGALAALGGPLPAS